MAASCLFSHRLYRDPAGEMGQDGRGGKGTQGSTASQELLSALQGSRRPGADAVSQRAAESQDGDGHTVHGGRRPPGPDPVPTRGGG